MSELPVDRTPEGKMPEKVPPTVTKDIEQMIGMVEAAQRSDEGASPVAAVWEDTYMDQIYPNYIIIHDQGDARRFSEVLDILRNNIPSDIDERRRLFNELDELAGTDVERGSLSWINQEGNWAVEPDSLREDAFSLQQGERDMDAHETHVAHFADQDPEEGGEAQSRRMREEEEAGPDSE